MSGLTLAHKKEFARTLIVNAGCNQKEAAARVGVSEKTMGDWCEKYSWHEQRSMMTVTREGQLKHLYAQLQELNKAIGDRDEGKRYPNAKEADTLKKITAAIRDLTNEVGITEIINVSMEVLDYVRTNDPDKAKGLSEVFDSVIKSKLR